MKTVIMAGGKGTRIQSVASDIPKPMIKIEGKPVLERELECLRSQGFTDIIMTVSHLREQIIDYFGDGSRFGVFIKYFEENVPLGNAGALFRLQSELIENFLLLNADSIFDIDFQRLTRYHREKGGLATLFTHPNSHPYDSGLVITGTDGAVEKWLTKEDARPEFYENRVNAGLHVLSPQVLRLAFERKHPGVEMPEDFDAGMIAAGFPGVPDGAGFGTPTSPEKWDLDRDLLKPLAGTGQMFAYDSPEYVKDMGTPERYEAVCRDFRENIPARRNLLHQQKAVFLDRDGVINEEVGFCHSAEEFTLLPWAAENIRKINESGYLAIVVTNQPVIARGEMTFAELARMHQKMATELGKAGAYLDGIYFCPHHPDRGFAGEVPELKIVCSCRKPKPGMLIKAAEDFHLDLSECIMIGDSDRDIKAGKAAGCRQNILVETNKPWNVVL